MPPSKFVAPVRKNGGQSFSFSSNMSSNGSISTSPPDVIPSSQPPVGPVQTTSPPAEDNSEKLAAEPSGSGLSGPSPQEPSKPTMKRPLFQGPRKVAAPNNGQDPPLKKQKRESTPHTPISGNTKSDICGNDDKENQKPSQSKKKVTEEKRPCKSLTDQQYELIFNAVLSKYRCDDDAECSNLRPEQTEQAANKSFHFSQSDLEDDDSEVKDNEATKECTSKLDSNEVDNSKSKETVNPVIVDKQPVLSKTTVAKEDHKNNGGQSQIIPEVSVKYSSQIGGVPPSPCITFMCHPSQPDQDLHVTQTKTPIALENHLDNSEINSQCSQGSTSAKPNVCPEIFVTPQKCSKKSSAMNSCVTPMEGTSIPTSASSQDLPSTPIMISRPSSQSHHTPVSTSSRKSSNLPSSQTMLSVKSPLATPHQSFAGSQGSSQEPHTPKCTSNKQSTIPGTSQSALLKVASPAPSTPRGSQLSQELHHTPPPHGLSAKERLLWLQEKRVTGIWVQCDETPCGKWRFLPDCHDPSTLPKIWKCSMHPDKTLNHCDAEEKRLNLLEEEDMIFNKYSPGSLVWAKLSGYPWWPAMVEDDPDLEMFYWLNLFSDIPTWYHVVFFDDVGRPRTRAWVQVERLQSFESKLIEDDDLSPELMGYKKRVSAATKIARAAQTMSMKDRLDRYSFAVSYKGPIGGPSKKKYEGPIGLRKPMTD